MMTIGEGEKRLGNWVAGTGWPENMARVEGWGVWPDSGQRTGRGWHDGGVWPYFGQRTWQGEWP